MDRCLIVCAAMIMLNEGAEAQSITVAAAPTVSIGQVDGDPNYLLNRVSHVRKLSDGRIMVTMGPDIRFYDGTGRHLSNAGGRGRGPGEFQHIQDVVVLPGDTLLILHFRDKVWLAPDGKYLRQESMDLAPLAADGWMSEGAMLLPNGNLLASQYQREEAHAAGRELRRPVLRYSLFDLATKQLRPLITAGGLRQIVSPGGGGGVQTFSPHAQHAIGSSRIYVGDNDTTFVSVFTFEGRHIGNIEVARDAVPVTARDLDTARDAILERIGNDAERRTRFEQSWAAVPQPARYPYWGSAVADRLGHLWVSSYARPGPALVWAVYDPTGQRVGEVRLPATFRPLDIGTDYMLGVERDEFDVEYVRVYPISRRIR